MKLEYLANINNFLKKQNTDHYVRHFSKGVVEQFRKIMRRKKRQNVEYIEIFDDTETIKRFHQKKDLYSLIYSRITIYERAVIGPLP